MEKNLTSIYRMPCISGIAIKHFYKSCTCNIIYSDDKLGLQPQGFIARVGGPGISNLQPKFPSPEILTLK